MSMQTHKTIILAVQLLEDALDLWFKNNDKHFPSIIILSKAAEELLGKRCLAEGLSTALDKLKQSVSGVHEFLYGKELSGKDTADMVNIVGNKLKHHSEETLTCDMLEEAENMLERAIKNYITIEGSPTPIMEKFLRR